MTLVRGATIEDRAQLEGMHQAYLEALAPHDHPDCEPHQLEDKWFTDRDRLFPYVVSDGDEVRGYMLVFGPKYSQAMGFEVNSYLHELFVCAEVRGSGTEMRRNPAECRDEHGMAPERTPCSSGA